VNFFTIIVVTMLKPLSDAAKRNERKRENQLIESQKGVLNKYILAISTVDVNNNNQRQESDPGQDNLEANEQSPRIMVSN
jgi:hypothetical protein